MLFLEERSGVSTVLKFLSSTYVACDFVPLLSAADQDVLPTGRAAHSAVKLASAADCESRA